MRNKVIAFVVLVIVLGAFMAKFPPAGRSGTDSRTVSDRVTISKKPEGCTLLKYEGRTPLPESESSHQDLRGGMECVFTIHPTLPQFRFHFVGEEDNTIHTLEVFKDSGTTPIQTLSIEIDTRALSPQEFEGIAQVDGNFDGYRDLSIKDQCGATGNCTYAYYLYDAATGQFESSEFLSGNFNPIFDLDARTVTFSGNSSARDNSSETYAYENGKFVLVSRYESVWNRDEDTVTENVYELRDGKMKLVSSTTTPNY